MTPVQRHIAVFRWIALLSVVPVTCIAAYLLRDEFSLQRLAEHDAFIRGLCERYPVVMLLLAFAVYVLATGASVPGAAGLTLACGWLFGFWAAVILVSVASTTGATLAFLVSRIVLRDAVRARFADRLGEIESALLRDGAFYLFLLRLIPIIPFFVINIVMGLTPIRLRTFWWVSQAGMLPATVLYVSAGASVPSLRVLFEDGVTGILTLKVVAAFTALGLLPLIARQLLAGRRMLQSAAPSAQGSRREANKSAEPQLEGRSSC